MHFYHVFLACSISSFRYVYHIFILYMTFMVIDYIICYVLFPGTVIIYCDHVIFSHINFSYITSDHIISCYRTYHHIAVLCFSYHIISFHMSYSNHLFYVSCLEIPKKWIHETYKGPKALYSLYETVVLSGFGGVVLTV